MIRSLVVAVVLGLGLTSVAKANDAFDLKDVGFLLDVVSATDASGTPVSAYLQKMAKLGDKWNVVKQTLGTPRADGKYEDYYEIVNNGCAVSIPNSTPCKVATLKVKVVGQIGSTPTYETSYSEVNGSR